MVYRFFDKKTGSGVKASVNKELVQEPHKSVIKKFKRRRSCARFKDDIGGADLAEVRSLSSKNRGVKYLLCLIYVFTKCAWFKPFKGKKSKTVLHGFDEMVNESKRKSINYWFIEEENFTIALCKTGLKIMIF